MKPTDRKAPPPEAFRFAGQADVDEGEGGNGAAGKFRGIAYSGEIIRNHWYWGNVIFDLATTQAAARIPVLIQHDPDQRAGFAALEIGDQIKATGTLMANAHGEAVASESRAGFPWQMSVRIEPLSVEKVAPGAQITVNGRPVTGPATVFRHNTIREVSFTPIGADPATAAEAMAHRFSDPDPDPEPDMELKEALERIATLEAENKTFSEAAQRAEAEAKAARDALQAFTKARREEAVKELFAALGREHTPEAAAPYLAMDETTFSAIAADLKRLTAAKRPDDATLFADQAGGEGNHEPSEQARDAAAAAIAKYL